MSPNDTMSNEVMTNILHKNNTIKPQKNYNFVGVNSSMGLHNYNFEGQVQKKSVFEGRYQRRPKVTLNNESKSRMPMLAQGSQP